MNTPNDSKTMMDCIDSIEEKLTMIMDHLGIQAPDDSEGTDDNPVDDSKMSMMDKITSSKGE